MDRIETVLEELSGAGDDPRLAAMGDAVLSGVAARKEKRLAWRALAFTGLFALGVGFAGGLMTPPPPTGAAMEGAAGGGAVLVLNNLPASAPSALLMGGR